MQQSAPTSMSTSLGTRHKSILDLARRDGRVLVSELAGLLSVSPQTLRKDLNDLCELGFMSRIHGGAVLSGSVENLGYLARKRISPDEKRAIGRAAAEIIPDGASLFINIGTTTEEVARVLANRSDLLVITNNLNVVDILGRSAAIEVIVVGGRVRQADRATVGPAAVEFIKNFKVDFAVIGSSAIDADGTLLDFDLDEVQVSHAIVQNARSIILVADQTKLNRRAPVKVGHLSDVTVFVTDAIDDPALITVCEANEVRIVLAPPGGAETAP